MRKIAFWLSLAVIFTFPSEDMIGIPGFGSLSRLVGLGVAAFWLFTIIVTGKLRRVHPLHILISLFLLWNAATLLWCVDTDLTITRLKTYVQVAGMFWLLWDLYTTQAALRAGLQAYVLGVFVSMASLIYNFLRGIEAYEFAHGRFSATGTNPNSIGLIMALGLPMAWYLAVTCGNGRKTDFMKWLNYAFVPTASFCILLTASRGSLIASTPAFVFIVGTIGQLKAYQRVLICLAIFSALAWTLPRIPQNTLQRILSTQDQIETADLNGRVAIWQSGVEAFQLRPLSGFGSDNYRVSVKLRRAPHNTFLSILVDTGLIGFAIFASMIGMTFRQAVGRPGLEAWFWVALLSIWLIGANVHNWEHTKHTWMIMSFVTIAASLPRGSFSGEQRAG